MLNRKISMSIRVDIKGGGDKAKSNKEEIL